MNAFLRRLLRRTLKVAPVRDAYIDIARLLSNEKVEQALDVGACRGTVSLRLARLFPTATIHAFEPHPESFAQLEANTRPEPRVRCHRLALDDAPGEATLRLNAVPGSSSLLPRPRDGQTYHNPQARAIGETNVRAVTLDAWVGNERVERVDVIKLDVQGAELRVLHGAERVLRHVKLVYTEAQWHPTYEGAALLCDVWAHLRRFGFSLFHFYNTWGGEDGQVVQGDALFIHAELRARALGASGAVRTQSFGA
ncbi:MAG: hypothetical protein FLDDKLPJ_03393 [Phycisphaerae bacterium]|nr:hypothetical protein [Phycisphaerae bacterium]